MSQVTLGQHRSELHWSTSLQSFSINICAVGSPRVRRPASLHPGDWSSAFRCRGGPGVSPPQTLRVVSLGRVKSKCANFPLWGGWHPWPLPTLFKGQVYMDKWQFFHFAVDGHLGFFQFLAVMNKAAVNILIQLFLWTCVSFFSLRNYQILLSRQSCLAILDTSPLSDTVL